MTQADTHRTEEVNWFLTYWVGSHSDSLLDSLALQALRPNRRSVDQLLASQCISAFFSGNCVLSTCRWRPSTVTTLGWWGKEGGWEEGRGREWEGRCWSLTDSLHSGKKHGRKTAGMLAYLVTLWSEVRSSNYLPISLCSLFPATISPSLIMWWPNSCSSSSSSQQLYSCIPFINCLIHAISYACLHCTCRVTLEVIMTVSLFLFKCNYLNKLYVYVLYTKLAAIRGGCFVTVSICFGKFSLILKCMKLTHLQLHDQR